MNILVIGGSGFIGSHIADKLIEKQADVTVFDVIQPGNSNVNFLKGDILSLDDLVSAMRNADFVYHLAGLSDINKVADNPIKTVQLNILGTINVLEAAKRSNIERLIFASSYFVQSGHGHLYSTTKYTSEMLCKDYYNLYQLPFTILRYGTVYGPRNRNDDVISIFVKKAFLNQPLVIYGDGNQTRNFIYVDDVAEGSVAALSDNAKNKMFFLDGSESVSINKVVTIIKELIGDVNIEYRKARFDDFKGKKVSIESVKNELNWTPKITVKEGLKRYIEWYIANSRVGK